MGQKQMTKYKCIRPDCKEKVIWFSSPFKNEGEPMMCQKHYEQIIQMTKRKN